VASLVLAAAEAALALASCLGHYLGLDPGRGRWEAESAAVVGTTDLKAWTTARLRHEEGFSQRELARRASVSLGTVRNLEDPGHRHAALSGTLAALSLALRVTVGQLTGRAPVGPRLPEPWRDLEATPDDAATRRLAVIDVELAMHRPDTQQLHLHKRARAPRAPRAARRRGATRIPGRGALPVARS